MLNRFFQTALVLAGLVVLYIGLLSSEWLPWPDAAEREAVEFAARPLPEAQGRSAFAILWYVMYDLGDRDPEVLMRQDVERLRRAQETGEAFESVAAGLPQLSRPEPMAFCPAAPESCLAYVRGLPDQGVADLAEHARLLQRLDAIADADHFRYPFPITADLPLPWLQVSSALRMQAAREFVAGSPRDGLARACRDLATFRRLTPTSDLLITRMITSYGRSGAAALVAEMLAEWPAGEPPPPPCDAALVPLAEVEKNACDSWRGEYRYMALTATMDPDVAERTWLAELVNEVGSNERAERARAARVVMGGCGRPYAPDEPGWMDWVFNPIGTREAEHGSYFPDYFVRLRDDASVVEAVTLLAWLRNQPDPAAAMSTMRTGQGRPPGLIYDDATRTLYLQRGTPDRHPEIWTFPLPPPQLPASPDAG